MIANMGGWNLPQYMGKKRTAGDILHKRDIMPHCVVDLVRTKYPNPKDKPYMGHKWQ
jgi:hypothetical protein